MSWIEEAAQIQIEKAAAKKKEEKSQMAYKPTILIDFDGVLSQYNGKYDPIAEPGPPTTGARAACFSLAKHYKLLCFTTRNRIQVEPWLSKYGFSCIQAITSIKVPAFLQIDDRSIQFVGNWSQTLKEVEGYKPWWENGEEKNSTT